LQPWDFFTGAGLLITSQTQAVWQLYLVYGLLMAAGTGEAYTLVVGFVSRWFRKKRGLALGLSTSGGGIGSLVYAPFASYLIVSLNWRLALVVMGFIALVVVCGLSLLLKGYPREIGLLPDGEKPDTAVKNEAVTIPPLTGYSLAEAIKTRPFWFIFMVWVFQESLCI
jgi:MFS family permease